MRKLITLFVLVLLITFSSFLFASEGEEKPQNLFGFHMGVGLELKDSVSTHFPEEKISPATYAWQTEGLVGGNYFFGFRINNSLNESVSVFWGIDYLSLNARYEITKAGSTLAKWTFRAPCFYIPLEIHFGKDIYFSLGGFFNYVISDPSYEDSNSDKSFSETGDLEEKYYNKLTYGLTVGVGVNGRNAFFYMEYRHGLKPWLKTPYEEASIRSLMIGCGFWFN